MKVIEHIEKSDTTLFSFEILPPKKGDNIYKIYETIDPLMEYEPAFIDVTYHREEVVYKKRKDDLLERQVVRKRPGTVGITAAIQYKYKIDVIPHIICGGFSKEETENGLLDLNFLGVNNLLVIRGDNMPGEKYFHPEQDGHRYALDLVNQIMELNNGIYLDDEILNSTPTNFSLGVAGYPEKHQESPNMDTDIKFLKMKVDAGAEYIVTQMFFDNQKYYNFVDRCRSAGITVPIIPGLKPVAVKNHMNLLPQVFNIDLPDDLVTAINNCKSNSDVRQVGIEWSIEQAKDLLQNNVPVLHFYTMSKSDNIREIAKAVF
jgi:methylenetetrahydrofolate reductase (NADPH)